MAISVLVADAHAVMRAGLRAVLEAQEDIRVVGEAADGVEAVAMARKLRPDVAMLDLVLPQFNGVEAAKSITQELGVPVVGVSEVPFGASAISMKGACDTTGISACLPSVARISCRFSSV